MPDIDFIESPGVGHGFSLRGRQQEWLERIKADLVTHSRLLCVAPGGVGKTTIFAALALWLWNEKGIRTLVLENRDRLTEQTADRMRKETGLDVDIEKGDQRASPYAPIVVMCVQSGSKISRLTSFSPDHFGVVVADECHLALSPSWLRIIFYFHHGAESLAEDWVRPKDGTYAPRARLVGFTASPNLGGKSHLNELFHKLSVNYDFLSAIEEGWLVGIEERNVPVKIDVRKFRVKRTQEGSSFNTADQNEAMIPIINELAAQYREHASDKKGIMFVPSVEIARKMADALNDLGITAIFVSGECIDKNDKTDLFAASGPGTVLVNCCLYNYGVDFPDTTCVAPFGAIISKVKYIQSIYRGTRVLEGTLKPGMSEQERVAAIAASKKPRLLVLSPFYISDRISVCEAFDLFGERHEGKSKVKKLTGDDMANPKKVRDYIAALEKENDKHQNRQPRTFDPVKGGLMIGVEAIEHYQPQNAQDAEPPTKAELDYLLARDYSSVDIKNSGQAQLLIRRIMDRERLGLTSIKTIEQLTLRLGWPKEMAMNMKQRQAGLLIGKGIRYRKPTEEHAVVDGH